ncbi:MAG: cellulase family glycosylhydrolase [Clostridia bacterium]|nr:cellulase family glycosylhydrolase [Clostridia bacterium]
MLQQWTKEQAWEWYKDQPWIRGFNGYPSNCVNRIAMWQEYNHKEVIEQIRYEFDLAKKTGLNAVRAIIQFEVWYYEHDSFMNNLEEYIAAADEFGIKVMLTIGNDCTVPKELFVPAKFGEQKVDWGYHSGICRGPHAGGYTAHGYMVPDEPDMQPKFFEMVDEIAAKYAKDPRIQIWDVWNEISNGRRGDMSVPMMEKLFEIIRSHDPIQPLTADCWAYDKDLMPSNSAQLRACELSDIITFHYYGSFQNMIVLIENLKEKYGRPLINNEWLNRISHNNVDEIFPLFYLEEIGSYHWGLIQGFSQTYEPWGTYMKDIEDPEYYGPRDLTKYQHDLYRFNGKPYIAKEIQIMQRFAAMADKRYEARQAAKNK